MSLVDHTVPNGDGPRQKRYPEALDQSCRMTIRKTHNEDQVRRPAQAHAGVQWSRAQCQYALAKGV
jgi:hypothetical protein